MAILGFANIILAVVMGITFGSALFSSRKKIFLIHICLAFVLLAVGIWITVVFP